MDFLMQAILAVIGTVVILLAAALLLQWLGMID